MYVCKVKEGMRLDSANIITGSLWVLEPRKEGSEGEGEEGGQERGKSKRMKD